ncbi:hypothetical protein Micbo1qcDRAFT_218143 [Microdochium bolleyi]|uniref:SH3 domain-containing protein n=1 Tax=Microdochium bolleyi TaxID=196109 RepID=A0A136JGG4_9PEZI|nr:hypothetical protein Micbo1qcDRAFT_218143 [Microdochium bolleyi]
MAIDADVLVNQPFRELVERGQEAITNAQDAADEDPDVAKLMTKAATGLVKEGERALGRLQPLWEQQSQKYGDAFSDAIRDNTTIAEGRRVLEDLLYDFDDYTELDTFEAERYTQLQSASKAFARSAIETIKTMKIDAPVVDSAKGLPPVMSSTPITPTSPDPTQLSFPPLPPLPPLSPRSAASRPQTAYEATQLVLQGHNGQVLPPLPALRSTNGLNSMRSSKSDGLARNDTLRSHSSQGSNRRASSKMASTQYHNSVQVEVAEQAHRVSPNLEVLGEEMGRIRLVQGGAHSPAPRQQLAGSPAGDNRLAPNMPASPWTVPRTTAWVTEQANSADGAPPQRFRDSIPEDMTPGSGIGGGSHARPRPAVDRYTSDSSMRASSVFDGPGSPETSGYRTSDPRYSNGEDFSDNHHQHRNGRTSSLMSAEGREHLDVIRPGSRMDALAEHDEPLPIQMIDPQSFDTGLMLARENDGQSISRSTTPVWYSRKANCEIGPESTLYQKGGFCRGALAFRTDGMESGTKPTYDYMSKTAKNQCISCEFQQDSARIQNDIRRAANSNFITEGVIYRSRFLYKSHMSTNISTSTPFGCVFCAQEGRTTREGDATMFSNKDQLFKHIAAHPQPLIPVTGITVLYGVIPKDHQDINDFDLHFPEPPVVNAGILSDAVFTKMARLPTGLARKDHIQAYGPDNLETSILRFYAGARIIGIEFPEEHDGKWCRGWHDGLQGYFPSKILELEPPGKTEVRLPGMNNDGVTLKARWKWQPKDAAAGWLSFDKGDVISNVSWTNQEQWCWSGITKNGKAGFFPQTHIRPDSIVAATAAPPAYTPSGGTKSIKSGSKMKMFGLKRTTTVSSNHS